MPVAGAAPPREPIVARSGRVVHEIMDGHRPAVWLSDRNSAQRSGGIVRIGFGVAPAPVQTVQPWANEEPQGRRQGEGDRSGG